MYYLTLGPLACFQYSHTPRGGVKTNLHLTNFYNNDHSYTNVACVSRLYIALLKFAIQSNYYYIWLPWSLFKCTRYILKPTKKMFINHALYIFLILFICCIMLDNISSGVLAVRPFDAGRHEKLLNIF